MIKRIYEFGPFQLDAAERLLLRGGDPVQVTPKAFDTLLVLIESSGHVLEKEEMMRLIWPDTFVEDANLAVNISQLRKALGEREGGGQYIETVPRRGYRFTSSVRELIHDTSEDIVRELVKKNPLVEEQTGYPIAGLEKGVVLMRRSPEIRYARSGDINIAYQVVGDAPLTMVFVMGWVSHLEYFWEEPSFARFLTRLSSFSRLILFDKRGTGLSDRVPLNQLPTLEQRMDDVRAVMDAVGCERAALVGVSEGGPMCSLFAASYPEKTSALVMIGTYAKRIWDTEYPWAPTAEERQGFLDEIERRWGGPVGIEERAPSKANDPQFKDWWATYLRMGASPGAACALTRMNAEIDVRHVLPTIRVPTLVIHRAGDLCLKVEEGRYVAQRIPGAKYVELPGLDHLPFVGDQNAILDEIEEFLTGVRHNSEGDRVLATVLFAEASGPLVKAVERGDRDSQDLIDRFHMHVRKEIELFRGREVGHSQTKFLATFDGPARAIRAASTIIKAAARLGVAVRAGLHTGECDIQDHKVTGTAVQIGTQVAARAAPGEVMVSSTVKDLVAGSGIRFSDRGTYSFGADLGDWRLLAVERLA
jgi:DNA-binding winged helix-turn-helix (wHTH) protein/pimeloyl-ACP methyl ester carboxylesterase/class 3 adenylate cyclase